MNLIVNETNRYAEKFIQEKRDNDTDNSHLPQWEPITIFEMKTFFGILILMGIVYKPDMHMYRSTDIYYAPPIFSQIMKRDQFYFDPEILSFQNFNDKNWDNFGFHCRLRDVR